MSQSPRLLRTPANNSLFFKGRTGDVRLGEWVQAVDDLPKAQSKVHSFVLFGCADDQGVTLNRGRAGAKLGPDGIRKHLYKMAIPFNGRWEKKLVLYDLGNLIPTPDIQKTHIAATEVAEAIAKAGHGALFLGGGHDFAAPNYLGFKRGRSGKSGLLNVDPHLDVRELENNQPHSGTPFRQILDAKAVTGFLEFGARENRNTRAHYEFCKKNGATVQTLEEIRKKPTSPEVQFKAHLKKIAAKSAWTGVTIDMDSCSDAEGTSAAPVIGFSAWELYRMSEESGREKRVQYFEIAEVAPPLDPAERASRIAAELLFSFLNARSGI